MAFRDGQGSMRSPYAERRSEDLNRDDNGVTVAIFPAADVAPSTEITVTAEIRTFLLYEDVDQAGGLGRLPNDDDDGFDVTVRTRLNVRGVTQTAVGEVGAFIRLQAGDFIDADDDFEINKGYGWWKFAPGWELMAGYNDNTAAIQAGVDWDFTFDAGGSISNSNIEQMRLTWNDGGPLSFAVAVEDSEGAVDAAGVTRTDTGDIPAFAAYGAYNSDGIFLQITGAWQEDDAGDDDDWFLGAGARFGLGDMFTFTAAAGFADGYCRNWFGTLNCDVDSELWGVNAGIITKLAEDIRFELGAWYGESDDNDTAAGVAAADEDGFGILGGLYWDPVSQVTVGVFAEYDDIDVDGAGNDEHLTALFGTWLRF
jgi:hypothetical protein